jgi:predicted  nucleic acid-binding Zn-ribbon protein
MSLYKVIDSMNKCINCGIFFEKLNGVVVRLCPDCKSHFVEKGVYDNISSRP